MNFESRSSHKSNGNQSEQSTIKVIKYPKMKQTVASYEQYYQERMRVLSASRDHRGRFRSLMKKSSEEVDNDLKELRLSDRGSHRAKAERLFRGCLKTIGTADVPWLPEIDEAPGTEAAVGEELVMLPTIDEQEVESEVEEATGVDGSRENHGRARSRSLGRDQTGHQPPKGSANTGTIPRINIEDDGAANTRWSDVTPSINPRNSKYLLPSYTSESRATERGRQSRRTQNSECQTDYTELDDIFVPRRGGFERIKNNPPPRSTPNRRRRVILPENLDSDTDDIDTEPESRSCLKVDFRNLSPHNGSSRRRGASPSRRRHR